MRLAILLGALGLAVSPIADGELPEGDEIVEIETDTDEESDKVRELLSEFFEPQTVAMIMSWIAYAGTIIGFASKIKSLAKSKQLTAESVRDAILESLDGKVDVAVKKAVEEYTAHAVKATESTQECVRVLAEIIALSQNGDAESKLKILELIMDMGAIGKDAVEYAKTAIEAKEAETEAKAEALSAIAEETKPAEEGYDGTSI